MVKISIISLIYKSTKLADWIYNSVMEYTPMIHRGEAEFFFIANDASDEVISHLIEKKYKFFINENPILSEDELFKKGYAMPEYVGRVYRGYNQAILHAKGEQIVLIHPNYCFSEDWLENLLKYSSFNTIISPQIVESTFSLSDKLKANFGQSIETFEKEKFIEYSLKIKKVGLKKGGAFMPCLFYKDLFIYAGLYPEGNIAGENYNIIKKSPDADLYERLMNIGITHYTALDSVIYHINESEKDIDLKEINNNITISEDIKSKYIIKPYNTLDNIKLSSISVYLVQSTSHQYIIDNILSNTISSCDKIDTNLEKREDLNINKINELNNKIIELNNKIINIINFIAWFIPFRKLRDKFRNKINKIK